MSFHKYTFNRQRFIDFCDSLYEEIVVWGLGIFQILSILGLIALSLVGFVGVLALVSNGVYTAILLALDMLIYYVFVLVYLAAFSFIYTFFEF